MSIRQQKYKRNRLAGMSQYNAARAAGYSESYAKKACNIEKSVKVSIQDALEQAGLTDKVIAETAYKWITGKNGKVAHSFFRTAMEMTGRLSNKAVNAVVNNVGLTPSKPIVFVGVDNSDFDAETGKLKITDEESNSA